MKLIQLKRSKSTLRSSMLMQKKKTVFCMMWIGFAYYSLQRIFRDLQVSSLTFDICFSDLFFIKHLSVSLRVEDVFFLSKYVVALRKWEMGKKQAILFYSLKLIFQFTCRVHEQLHGWKSILQILKCTTVLIDFLFFLYRIDH